MSPKIALKDRSQIIRPLSKNGPLFKTSMLIAKVAGEHQSNPHEEKTMTPKLGRNSQWRNIWSAFFFNALQRMSISNIASEGKLCCLELLNVETFLHLDPSQNENKEVDGVPEKPRRAMTLELYYMFFPFSSFLFYFTYHDCVPHVQQRFF